MRESVRVEHGRLREAAALGTLAELCLRHDLDLFVVFGSVLAASGEPHDLDIAIRFCPVHGDPDADATSAHLPTLEILDELYRLTGSERIDLMVLNRAGPLARERALITGEPLFQAKAGVFANAQIAAIMGRLDTDRFRAMDLELMSS